MKAVSKSLLRPWDINGRTGDGGSSNTRSVWSDRKRRDVIVIVGATTQVNHRGGRVLCMWGRWGLGKQSMLRAVV